MPETEKLLSARVPSTNGKQPTHVTTPHHTPEQETAHEQMRRIMKYANRFFMVPAFRLGFGPFIGTPPGGYIMVLKTTGKKSGLARYTPLNYAVVDGNVYCIAGWGKASHWFSNLVADPHVELIMPGGAISGLAEEVSDRVEARRLMLKVTRNTGFVLLFDGLNPLTATDEQIVEKVGDVTVVRIRPTGIGSGAYDPGGWGWVLPTLAQAAGVIWIGRRITRAARKRLPSPLG